MDTIQRIESPKAANGWGTRHGDADLPPECALQKNGWGTGKGDAILPPEGMTQRNGWGTGKGDAIPLPSEVLDGIGTILAQPGQPTYGN